MKMETRKTKKDEWIKLASKSRPGRFYLFNKSTGETEWLPRDSSTEAKTKDSEKMSPPKLALSKSDSKTPAQDRLKRLQNNLKANQIKSQSSRGARHTSDLKLKKVILEAKEQENQEMSSTSLAKSKSKINLSSPKKSLPSPKKNNKKQYTDINNPPTEAKVEKTSNDIATPSKAYKSLGIPENSSATKRESKIALFSTESGREDKQYSSKGKQSLSIPESQRIPITESKVEKSSDCVATPSKANKYLGISESASTTKRESQIDLFSLPSTESITMDKQNEYDWKSSTLNNIRTGIVKKIKEICKIPFTTSKKPPEEKFGLKKVKSSLHLINTTPFKPYKSTEKSKVYLSASLQGDLRQLKEEQEKIIQNVNLKETNTSLQRTPKNLNIPTYQRGSANSRLERLRQSLQVQQPSTSVTSSSNWSLCSSTSEANIFNTSLNNSTNSIYTTANNTIYDDVEAMDWQPIIKDEPIEILSSESIMSNVFKRPSAKVTASDKDGETMGDIYDAVNENLLRFSAERKDSSNNNKWLKEYYYFIADTNILLRDLCFIDDLCKMKLCDTKGSMLYIPYCVLQELDILKMRSGCQEGVKTLSVRAIKYLNKKFENKSNHLQAQSALEERHRLIDINSADDSIINCCLQAKEHVPNLILLTEDVNLRNKAICNNILVSTKSDLISKHYETS